MGQQWRAALDDIGQSNRLPRGRRYANNGSVRSIEIGDGVGHAKVQGSRRHRIGWRWRWHRCPRTGSRRW